jgi:aminoacrylate hydrolase
LPDIAVNDITLHYEQTGEHGSPVLLLTGLGGVGKSWGPQLALFGRDHRVVAPDHRGTGASTAARDGYSIQRHAEDIAALVRGLGLGPVHLVGLSTGGAIGQVMALDHRDTIKTLTLCSTWARGDAYFHRQMGGRKRALVDSGLRFGTETNALFLFSPQFHREHPERIEAWVDTVVKGSFNQDIALARIDMVLAHDQLDRIGGITCPVLIVAGKSDQCTPMYLAEELHHAIPRSEFATLDAGHFSCLEKPEDFHRVVAAFITAHEA